MCEMPCDRTGQDKHPKIDNGAARKVTTVMGVSLQTPPSSSKGGRTLPEDPFPKCSPRVWASAIAKV